VPIHTPFDRKAVLSMAQRAAAELLGALQSPRATARRLDEPRNGKTFGVLVGADRDGSIGYLRGCSGMRKRLRDIDGRAPPTFDQSARDQMWGPGEAEMLDFAAQRAEMALTMPGDASSRDALRVKSGLRTLDESRTA
jgi:tRNA pseudouridine32 synthase/23S rRNA pseudouridine746 synthase